MYFYYIPPQFLPLVPQFPLLSRVIVIITQSSATYCRPADKNVQFQEELLLEILDKGTPKTLPGSIAIALDHLPELDTKTLLLKTLYT